MRPRVALRRAVWPLAAILAFVSLAFLAGFPTRTYLQQRRDRAAAEARLRVLEAENRKLADQARRLLTDAEVERLARQEYNLVKPGEEAYAILPAPTGPVASSTTTSTTTTATPPP